MSHRPLTNTSSLKITAAYSAHLIVAAPLLMIKIHQKSQFGKNLFKPSLSNISLFILVRTE